MALAALCAVRDRAPDAGTAVDLPCLEPKNVEILTVSFLFSRKSKGRKTDHRLPRTLL